MVYQSKKEDVWAKILKHQIEEEEVRQEAKRRAKLAADEEYGAKLREQERVKAEMEAQYVHRGEVLANSKEGVV